MIKTVFKIYSNVYICIQVNNLSLWFYNFERDISQLVVTEDKTRALFMFSPFIPNPNHVFIYV